MKKKALFLAVIVFLILILVAVNVYITNTAKTQKALSVPLNSPIALITQSPSVFVTAKVVRVIDGDTIVMDTGQHVRYIGMNTPEIESNECFASEASEINKNLVLDKTVKLEKDLSDVDKYGRLLRYVYIDDYMINNELVKEGVAKVMPINPDTKYKTLFLDSERSAKENKLGLWSKCF